MGVDHSVTRSHQLELVLDLVAWADEHCVSLSSLSRAFSGDHLHLAQMLLGSPTTQLLCPLCVAASDELLRGNVVLRGDGRTFRSSPHIPYIHYHRIVPDLLHLQMRVLSRQYPCVWCVQPAAEQD
jgi:hypothetical protein